MPRLFPKPSFTPTVGMKVTMKTEEELINEFGALRQVPFTVTSSMLTLVGEPLVIRDYSGERYGTVKLDFEPTGDDRTDRRIREWSYSTHMFKEVKSKYSLSNIYEGVDYEK